MNNDRFKVRVWSVPDREMTYPDGIEDKDDLSGIVFLSEYMEAIWNNEPDDNFILMACTGLRDSEGTLIWESDVFKHTYNDLIDGDGNAMTFYYSVVWNSYKACFALKQLHTGNEIEIIMDYKDLTGRAESVIVCGNIYEHPHLLNPAPTGDAEGGKG